MGGGLIQLAAIDSIDTYLTGNPQISFFKAVYRRHTNFSIESIELLLNGDIDFGNTVSANISRLGDLVMGMHLEASLVLNASGDNVYANVGSALINSAEIEIGGQVIDKHYGHWLETYAELTQVNEGPKSGTILAHTNGPRTRGTLFQNVSGMGGVSGFDAVVGWPTDATSAPENIEPMFIPLQFWFCRHPGLALPLIALRHHDVKIKIVLGNRADIVSANPSQLNISFWVDYIYLDTDERKRFVQTSHEYLIEQVQFQNAPTSNSFTLNLKHPVKELIWIGAPTDTATATAGPSTPNLVGGLTNTDVTDNLIFHMKFDETNIVNDRVTDNSIYANHGTLTNMESPIVTGKIGNALEFDGSNDYVEIIGSNLSGNVLFDISETSHSISCWININSLSANNTIVSKSYNSGYKDFGFTVSTDGSFTMNTETRYDGVENNDYYTSAASEISTGAWYHVCYTAHYGYDGSNPLRAHIKLYKNGSEVSGSYESNDYVETHNDNTYHNVTMKIGILKSGFYGGSRYLNGKIDDLRIYNRVLTPAEITELYTLDYSSSSTEKYKLVFNGQDRFAAKDFRYFTRMQVQKYHTGCGGLKLTANYATYKTSDTIAVYSFALKPEEYQPSGTCNFSRIDNAELKITQGSSKSLYIYAINYNILRVMNGMCGLAYYK